MLQVVLYTWPAVKRRRRLISQDRESGGTTLWGEFLEMKDRVTLGPSPSANPVDEARAESRVRVKNPFLVKAAPFQNGAAF